MRAWHRWGTLAAGAWVVAALAGCTTIGMGPLGGFGAGTTAAMVPNSASMTGDAREKGFAGDMATDGNGQQGSGLVGGEIDDNTLFEQYLTYLRGFTLEGVSLFDVSQRVQFMVTDNASKSMPNAEIVVNLDGTPIFRGKAAANGRVLFFPRAAIGSSQATGPFEVRVTRGATQQTFSMARDASGTVPVALDAARGLVAPKLDICFVLDVTSSMGDEMDRLRRTVGDITARIKSLPGEPSVRFGLVAFRDTTDDFVTRPWDFTSDLPTFTSHLNTLAAVGGGDYPEAVNEALDVSLRDLTWDATESLRLMFLIGDAPAQMGVGRDPQAYYTRSAVSAVAKGIKIFPLGASGLDPRGEYQFRQLAQVTGGKFLFLTYGGKTDLNVGPVQSNNLDDLVVGLVKGELSYLE